MDTFTRFGKTALLVSVLALLLINAASCSTKDDAGESTVDWLYDWEEAFSKAKREDQPLMINFYGDRCPACTHLDSTTFSDEELSAFLNDSFVPLKSNVGKSSLHGNYHIEALPTVVFASPQGTEIARLVGYRGPDKFEQEARVMLSWWESQSQS